MGDKLILPKYNFTPVNIDEFYDEAARNDAFSTDIIVLTENESELVRMLSDRLKTISPETLEGISNRIADVKRLAADIARFPSLLHKQTLSSEVQTQHTLAESLLQQRDGDKTLHLPTKAILGKGFLVAKFHAFTAITKIAVNSKFPEEEIQRLNNATLNIMFTIMVEDVYLSLLDDLTIPIDIRRQIAYSLIILWEHRSDQNVADVAPVLDAVWRARRKLAPAFGTMVGTSELLFLSIEMDDQWRQFIMSRLSDNDVSCAMQEYLFGLSHEQIQTLKQILREKGIAAIGRDEVSSFLGQKVLSIYDEDPRSFYLLYSVRRENAKSRKRMNLHGPHQTLEDHFMRFILERNKEKQHNDIYAK